MVRDLGLETAKAVSTPGSKDDANRALDANGYNFTPNDELANAKIAEEATVSSIAEGVEPSGSRGHEVQRPVRTSELSRTR